jgi:transcription-repair coupling factor (superfamily II helicase)
MSLTGARPEKLHKSAVGLAVTGIEHGFEAPDFAVVTEQDILGDRMVRSRGRARRSQNFLSEASALTPATWSRISSTASAAISG